MIATLIVLGGIFSVGIALASTSYNLNIGLCTYNDANRACHTQENANINIAQKGNYALKVTVERGNDISKYECQDQESFYMIVNGKKTPIIADPDRCEWQGTIKTQSVPGSYYLKKGNNTIKFYHAYNHQQANSIESLTIKKLEITRIPNPINGRCGSSNAKTFGIKPTTGLCYVGVNTNVYGIGPWNWQCLGSDGGQNVNCSANISNPQCGNANGKTFSVKPVAPELCSKGSATSVNSGSKWTWQCVNGTKKISCSANKYIPICGNKKIDTGEQCDDGNKLNDDGCSSSCKIESASIKIDKNDNDNGDDKQNIEKNSTAKFKIKVTNTGKVLLKDIAILDSKVSSCSKSSFATKILYSGNYLKPGESFTYTCADENVSASYINNAIVTAKGINNKIVVDNDASKVSVFIPNTCGDNKINQAFEQCDDGSDNGKVCVPGYGKTCSYCSTSCKLISLTGGDCGNGKIENDEQCDDGNNLNGDGCSATCSIEKPEPKPEPKPKPKPEPKPKPTPKKCKGSIGNYIWLDVDGDGNQDKNESGIKNIRLKLKWAGKDGKWGNTDDETWKTHTTKKGRYVFEDLCEGKYKLYVNDQDTKKYNKTYDPDSKKDNKTKIKLNGNKDDHTKADFGYNNKKSTPATGSGTTALYLSGLLSFVGFLSYKQYQGRLPSLKK